MSQLDQLHIKLNMEWSVDYSHADKVKFATDCAHANYHIEGEQLLFWAHRNMEFWICKGNNSVYEIMWQPRVLSLSTSTPGQFNQYR